MYAQSKVKEYRKIFESLDDNRSGSINSAEFKRALNKMKLNPSDDDITKMIRMIDRPSGNGCPPNGKIEYAEFRDFMLLAGETSSFADFSPLADEWLSVTQKGMPPELLNVVVDYLATRFHFRCKVAQEQRQVQRRCVCAVALCSSVFAAITGFWGGVANGISRTVVSPFERARMQMITDSGKLRVLVSS